ncbi:MAG TPA: heavy metal-binding domain-containing protein [Candidatus Obscuribacter sp.]|nr:heavy metal-binding domain-containing protein [Candidatus Obscuribacter sp.]
MPFRFFHSDENEKERRRLQDLSIEALSRGDITPDARRRLEAHKNSPFFTTTMSPAGLLLSKQAGYKVLTQVMGSSFIYVNREEARRTYGDYTCEVLTLTNSYEQVRTNALRRLRKEAALLEADGVVDVRVLVKEKEWQEGLLECTISGTAIRVPNKPEFKKPEGSVQRLFNKTKSRPISHPAGGKMQVGADASLDTKANAAPFLSNLTGQEFWQLYQAGYWPTTLVSANCCYFVMADQQARKAQSGFLAGQPNQELECFSKGIYHCRYQVSNKLKREAKESGGEGIIGVQFDSEIERVTFDKEPNFAFGINVNMSALGTAVRAVPSDSLPKETGSLMVLNLDRKKEK